jgi:hypothetical protein
LVSEIFVTFPAAMSMHVGGAWVIAVDCPFGLLPRLQFDALLLGKARLGGERKLTTVIKDARSAFRRRQRVVDFVRQQLLIQYRMYKGTGSSGSGSGFGVLSPS